MEFLFADNVYFSYDDTEEDGGTLQNVLNGVSLKINKGEYVAIIGHNGSGKSTLAKLFNLILDPTEGKIYYLGKDFSCDDVCDSAEILMRVDVDFEFRTTLVKELHTFDDIEEIGKSIKGAKRYFLQNFNILTVFFSFFMSVCRFLCYNKPYFPAL